MDTVKIKKDRVLCEVRSGTEKTFEHRAYNVTQSDGSTPINYLNGRFDLRIKKRPIKETMEKRVNIVSLSHGGETKSRQMDWTWWYKHIAAKIT